MGAGEVHLYSLKSSVAAANLVQGGGLSRDLLGDFDFSDGCFSSTP